MPIVRGRRADPVVEYVVAHCDTTYVPALDENAISARQRGRCVPSPSRVPLRAAAVCVAMLAVLVAITRMPVVVADVQRMFAAFSITPPRSAEMNVHVVDLKRAVRDMPFIVMVPPPIGGLPIASIGEVVRDGPKGNRSLIFELRKTPSGPEILVVESKASSLTAPALFTLGELADRGTLAPELPDLPAEHQLSKLPAARGRAKFLGAHEHNGLLLERDTSSDVSSVAPEPWTVEGTRIEILSPPGFLSPTALNGIRHAFLKTQ